jgi:hypothetical protein
MGVIPSYKPSSAFASTMVSSNNPPFRVKKEESSSSLSSKKNNKKRKRTTSRGFPDSAVNHNDDYDDGDVDDTIVELLPPKSKTINEKIIVDLTECDSSDET